MRVKYAITQSNMIQGECEKCQDRGDYHGAHCLVRKLIFDRNSRASRKSSAIEAMEAAVLALQKFMDRCSQKGMDCQIIPFSSIQNDRGVKMSSNLALGNPANKQVSDTKAIESVLIKGDLTPLNVEQRIQYYKSLCESLQLNWMTRPFDYIVLNGKLTLYAKKDCTEQLRRTFKVSIRRLEKEIIDGICIFTACAEMPDGRTDQSSGVVAISGLKGELLSNAVMKAETKAKRRVTLSICGLGFVDESEIDSIQGAKKVTEDYNPEEPPIKRDLIAPIEPSKNLAGGATKLTPSAPHQNEIMCCGKESIVSKFDTNMFYCYSCKSARHRFKSGDFDACEDNLQWATE